MKKNRIIIFIIFVLTLGCKTANIEAQQSWAEELIAPIERGNTSSVTIETEYDVVNSIDNGTAFLNKHFMNWGNLTPIIMTYTGNNGSVSICCADKNSRNIYIYEYTKDLVYIKTMQFQNPFDKFGAFTKDNEGNYYIFSANDVPEGAFNQNNMALVKYDAGGKQTAIFNLPAQTTNEKWAPGYSGVKIPFSTGSCKMEISGDWIAVYFARQMFIAPDRANHQASYGFILNKNNLTRISNITMPSAGHSFNQYIMPIENGFIFIDQGDVGPRGFYFSRVLSDGNNKSITSFAFKRGSTYQNTFSQLGGLAKTNSGYIFAGTYEKNTIVSSEHNDSRNVFVLTFDNELNRISQPVWITNYNNKDNDNAASPKIVELYSRRYLIMWELMTKNSYKSTYMTIIDDKGNRLVPIKELRNVRLNINDTLRYNIINGNVYWAVNSGNRQIKVYAFNPDE